MQGPKANRNKQHVQNQKAHQSSLHKYQKINKFKNLLLPVCQHENWGEGKEETSGKEVSDILLLTLGEPQPSHSPGKQCAVLEGCSAIQKLKAPVTMQM